MGTNALALFLILATGVSGQSVIIGTRPHPGPPRQPVQRPVRGIWGGWGGWGWANAEPVRIIVQDTGEKEKPIPPVVVNKEFVAERHSPRITEVASAPAADATTEWRMCEVKLLSGERFAGAECAEVDDALLVKSAVGRRYRFSRDLVDSIR